MFDVSEIYRFSGKAMGAILENRGKARINSVDLESALRNLKIVWNSEECQRYQESFGKLTAQMLTSREDNEGKAFQVYADFSYFGRLVDIITSFEIFDHPDLLNALASLHTYADLMKSYERAINERFANGSLFE